MKNLFIEIGAVAHEALAGVIKFFNRDKNFGYIEVPGKKDVRFTGNDLRFVQAGITYPKSGDLLDTEKFSVYGGMPVVFRRPQSLSRGWKTDCVLSQHHYDRNAKRIAERPLYRVIHKDARFKGQFAKTAVYDEGSLEQLSFKYPRVCINDPLGPEYTTGPITVHSRWEQKTHGGEWLECSDPRPFPANATRIEIRVTEMVKGEPIQRLHGHLGHLLEMPRSAFIGDQFMFEIRTGTVDFTEVGDPRRKKAPAQQASVQPVTTAAQPDRKRAEKPQPATQKSPVKMPRSEKAHTVVLKNLGDLQWPEIKK